MFLIFKWLVFRSPLYNFFTVMAFPRVMILRIVSHAALICCFGKTPRTSLRRSRAWRTPFRLELLPAFDSIAVIRCLAVLEVKNHGHGVRLKYTVGLDRPWWPSGLVVSIGAFLVFFHAFSYSGVYFQDICPPHKWTFFDYVWCRQSRKENSWILGNNFLCTEKSQELKEKHQWRLLLLRRSIFFACFMPLKFGC